MESLEIDASRRELQILMYGYGNHFSGQVQLAADRIYAETTDPTIREMAIMWKLNATPVMLKSCFANDPSGGLISAWVFALQMQEYFESGNGKEVFGPFQSIAVETSRGLTEQIVEIAQMTMGASILEAGAPKIQAWAAANPIENQQFVREDFAPAMAGKLAGNVAGGLGAAGAMNEQMLALTDRANIMTALLPRQVQWQTQLLLAQSDQMIASHLDSAFSDLQPFLDFLTTERRELTRDISSERTAILSGISTERLAVLEALAQERTAILTTIAEERNITLEEINKLTLQAIREIVEDSRFVADDAIDRVYLRSLQLLAIPFVVSVILMILVILQARRAINRIPDQRRRT